MSVLLWHKPEPSEDQHKLRAYFTGTHRKRTACTVSAKLQNFQTVTEPEAVSLVFPETLLGSVFEVLLGSKAFLPTV